MRERVAQIRKSDSTGDRPESDPCVEQVFDSETNYLGSLYRLQCRI